ncbi:uncharacterized protein ACN63O_012731 [Diretmus argenteus]
MDPSINDTTIYDWDPSYDWGPSYNDTTIYEPEEDPFLTSIYYVMTWIVISVGLPLILLAICALYSLVRGDHVAPVYVINLLVSDLIQICCMAVREGTGYENETVFNYSIAVYIVSLIASVGFMVCIALERYLVIAFPLWYRFRRNVKVSLVVSFMVWAISFVMLIVYLIIWIDIEIEILIVSIPLLLPFPLLIFFLAGTIKALSAAISVPREEKRRIVGTLVLVLLNYVLLFLPTVIWFLSQHRDDEFYDFQVCVILVQFSPLVDLGLYVFMRKGAVDTLLAWLCRCRLTREEEQSTTVNDHTTETVTV